VEVGKTSAYLSSKRYAARAKQPASGWSRLEAVAVIDGRSDSNGCGIKQQSASHSNNNKKQQQAAGGRIRQPERQLS